MCAKSRRACLQEISENPDEATEFEEKNPALPEWMPTEPELTPSDDYLSEWRTFLGECGVSQMSVIFCQYIGHHIFKQMIKLHYPLESMYIKCSYMVQPPLPMRRQILFNMLLAMCQEH